jgi:outer membrane protein with beta-barrel domain
MGRILSLVVLTIAMLASTAVAQGQGSEISGGYSFMSADGGGADRINMNGWNTGGTIFLNELLGIEGNFGSVGYSEEVSAPGASVEAKVKSYTYVFGPRFSFGKGERMNPYFHALLGFDRLTAETATTIGGVTTEISASDTGFATTLGGGVVLGMSKHFGINLGGDYLMTNHSATAHNFRMSAGVVFRFGDAAWGK